MHLVLEAFEKSSGMPLVLVGNWNNSEYGKQLKERYSHIKNIFLFDPIYNQREIDLIRGNASLYVHGHSAGGTNPSLVEAMYLELPIITFKVSYNITTTENKAIYFSTSDELIGLLDSLTAITLKKLRIEMKSIALRRYNWSSVSRQYELLIEEALSKVNKTSVFAETKGLSPSFLEKYQLGHLQNNNLFYEKR